MSTEQEQATLADLLLAETAEPTPGWCLLVRYVDTLCPLHQIRCITYGLQYEGGPLRDVSDGKVVARGAKSIMLELPGCDNTFKVSCLALLPHNPGHSLPATVQVHGQPNAGGTFGPHPSRLQHAHLGRQGEAHCSSPLLNLLTC